MEEVPESTGNWKPRTAGLAAGGLVFVGVLALTAPFLTTPMKSPLPYMATPSKKLHQALKHIQRKSAHGQALNFVDLGSGDGEGILQAAKLGYHQATGVEMNFTLWSISQLRLLKSLGHHERKRAHIICGDLFQQPLHDADAVLIFGVKPLMKDISLKLRRECRPGTHILSYRFPLPLLSTGMNSSSSGNSKESGDRGGASAGSSTCEVALLNAEMVYDEEEMRIYKVLG